MGRCAGAEVQSTFEIGKKMKYTKFLLILFLLLGYHCYGQAENNSLLQNIYDDFPIDAPLDSIGVYCRKHGLAPRVNVYDKTKTDFSGDIHTFPGFKYKPMWGYIEVFYAAGYATVDTVFANSLVIMLTAVYQDSVIINAIKEYKGLVKQLKKKYSNSGKFYARSEHGLEGEGINFYVNKRVRMPVITIEFPFSKNNELWKSQSIRLTYIRPYYHL